MTDDIQMEVTGVENVINRLRRLDNIQWHAIVNKSLDQMSSRAATPPGTPRDTGQLIQSRRVHHTNPGIDPMGMFGYAKHYAPHVEYGHATRNGGYVQGQHFLQRNAEIQRPIYIRDMEQALSELTR